MLVENQKVLISWATTNYKHYINKGYEFTKIHDKFYVDVCDLTKGSNVKVDVKCDFCGKIVQKNYNNYIKEIEKHNVSSCIKCKGKKIYMTNNIKEAPRQIELFDKLCSEKGYTPITRKENYININHPLKFVCPKHGEQSILLNNFKNGCGCPECGRDRIAQSHKLSPEEVQNIIESKNNSLLLNSKEYINAHTRNLRIKCGTCGDIYVTSLKNYIWIDTGKCPKCDKRQSIGELKIENFLIKNSIKYIKEMKFRDCRNKLPLPFDFYLPNYNMCIEFDGKQHYESIFGEKTFRQTILHDGMKNNYCKWNNIKLLRIPYWEGHNIEDVLKKELNLNSYHNKIQYIPESR